MLPFRYIIVVVCVLAGLADDVVSVAPTRTEPGATCSKSTVDDILTMRFVTDLKVDDINYVFGLDVDSEWQECTFTKESGTHNNVPYNHLIVETKIDMTDHTATVNPCGLRVEDLSTMPRYRLMLSVRQDNQIEQEIDGTYDFSCFPHNATQLDIALGMTVAPPGEEVVDIHVPDVAFEVLSEQGLQFRPINNGFCVIGEDLKLRLTLTISNPKAHLTPHGLYIFRTSFSSNSQGDENYYLIVDDDGCKEDTQDINLQSGWQRVDFGVNNADQVTYAEYETGIFECSRWMNTKFMFIRTFFDLCVGEVYSDNRCINYCDFNTARKRRQDNQDVHYNVTTSIEILTQAEADQRNTQSGESNAYIIAPIIAAVSVLVVALVFVAVFVCLVQKRRNHRASHSDVDSRASSDRKLPIL